MEPMYLKGVNIVSAAKNLKLLGQEPLESRLIKQAAKNILKNPANFSDDEVCYATYVQANSPEQ